MVRRIVLGLTKCSNWVAMINYQGLDPFVCWPRDKLMKVDFFGGSSYIAQSAQLIQKAYPLVLQT